MKPSDHQPAPDASDPLMSRLRALPAVRLDDVTAARTLARAESALTAAATDVPAARRRWIRVAPPAALAVWAILYVWGAVGALARLYPTASPASTAPPGSAQDRAQVLLHLAAR
jgi:hypothetical protein